MCGSRNVTVAMEENDSGHVRQIPSEPLREEEKSGRERSQSGEARVYPSSGGRGQVLPGQGWVAQRV